MKVPTFFYFIGGMMAGALFSISISLATIAAKFH